MNYSLFSSHFINRKEKIPDSIRQSMSIDYEQVRLDWLHPKHTYMCNNDNNDNQNIRHIYCLDDTFCNTRIASAFPETLRVMSAQLRYNVDNLMPICFFHITVSKYRHFSESSL